MKVEFHDHVKRRGEKSGLLATKARPEQKAVRPDELCSESSPKLEDDLHRVFEKARKAILVSRIISL